VKPPASRAGDGFAGKVAVLATVGTLFGFPGSSMHTSGRRPR
jgi:hypothetical protein